MLKITLTQGMIGKKETQKKVIKALGLGKYGSSVVHKESDTIKGMIDKVSHLVTVTTVPDNTPTGKITRKENK